ncbi:MAG TPA: hypothetical protein VM142_08205 [Acidimicrobiales bacterium]|nr:hypothetical protein [Acidimicrobiales bacterium]
MDNRQAEALLAVVAPCCPELSLDQVRSALDTTITNPAVARSLTAALAAGPEVVRSGAPPVVARLVGELRARGSTLQVRPAPPAGGPSGPSSGWGPPGSAHAVGPTNWPRPARCAAWCEW